MKIIQGIPPIVFVLWALGALAATQARAEYSSYEIQSQLQQQINQQKAQIERLQWEQQLGREDAAFDESERIELESEQQLYLREDHPEIYGEP